MARAWVQINPTYKLETDIRQLVEEGLFDPEASEAFSSSGHLPR